jgi:cold shock protein
MSAIHPTATGQATSLDVGKVPSAFAPQPTAPLFDYLSARENSVSGDTAAALASLRIGGIFAHRHWSLRMARGTVKWFNPTKGYGFIQPAGGGGKDVFVHISAVEKAGLSTLNEGQTVEYEEVPNKGKTSAENLKVV